MRGAARRSWQTRNPGAEWPDHTKEGRAMSVVGPVPPFGSDVPEEQAGGAPPGFLRSLLSLRTLAGATGLTPALLLLALSGVERFDFNAFGVLGPEIRAQFHLSNAGYVSIATLTALLPILATAHVGYLSD